MLEGQELITLARNNPQRLINLVDHLRSEAADWEREYRIVADSVITRFNPPDSDGAESAIVEQAITLAAEYIETQSCACPPGVATYDEDPCLRCAALGRRSDVSEER
jgi:hypothetical protein